MMMSTVMTFPSSPSTTALYSDIQAACGSLAGQSMRQIWTEARLA